MLMNMWNTTLVCGGRGERGRKEVLRACGRLRGWRDGEREGEERGKTGSREAAGAERGEGRGRDAKRAAREEKNK